MADTTYRTVRLMQNHIYPTYQLFAVMASSKTKPQDGLRLGALTTLQWLRKRLGEDVREESLQAPDPSDYLTITNDCLHSVHLNKGFVIDIVFIPDRLWTLQITEPDLGSNPGTPDQKPPVPGRVIETNVEFRIVGDNLECGFKTNISDPHDQKKPADVYRLALIRLLIRNPDFGLRQITLLKEEAQRITSKKQIAELFDIWKDPRNQLPCVIFSQIEVETPPLPAPGSVALLGQSIQPPLPSARKKEFQDPPYDYAYFARSTVTFCRCYLLEEQMRQFFEERLRKQISPGDVVALEPADFNNAAESFIHQYRPSKQRQDETMAKLRDRYLSYPRGREIEHGAIEFISSARRDLERLLDSASDELEQSQKQTNEKNTKLEVKIAQIKAKYRSVIDEKDRKIAHLEAELNRQRERSNQKEQKEDCPKEAAKREESKLEKRLRDKQAYIDYLERKLERPTEHSEIAGWVEGHFDGRIILHDKAVGLLKDKSAREFDISLICDALEFLANEYWAQRYAGMSQEEKNARCSEKYDRPFEVTLITSGAIERFPEYKIKYFPGKKGKKVESRLNYHLKVGKDSDFRIYFLHDDEKKIIVIGSLPSHLPTWRDPH